MDKNNKDVQTFLEICRKAAAQPLNDQELEVLNGLTAVSGGLEYDLGMKYTEVTPTSLSMKLTVERKHLQPWGLTNGGVYASLGEVVGSMASFVAAGSEPVVVGTNNNTDFLRPSKAGDVVVSTATAEHVGRSSHLWRVEHRNEATGKLLALTKLKTSVLG